MLSKRIILTLWFISFLLACLCCSSDDITGAGPALICLCAAGLVQLVVCCRRRVEAPIGLVLVLIPGGILGVLAFMSPVLEFALSDLALITAGLLVMFLASQFVKHPKFYGLIVFGLCVITLCHLGVVSYQIFVDSSWLPFYKQRLDETHISGIYNHRNYLGNLLAGITCISFSGCIFLKSKLGKLTMLIISSGLLMFVFWTSSRGASVALGFGMVTILLASIYFKWLDGELTFKKLYYFGLTGLGVLSCIYFGFSSALANRGLGSMAMNMHGREDILKIAIELIMDRPFLGSGARSFHWRTIEFWPDDLWTGAKDFNYAHNEYLQLLVDYGVVAGGVSMIAFFSLLCLFILRSNTVAKEHRVLYAGSFGCLVVFLVQALVSFPLHMLPNVMLCMGSVGVLIGLTSGTYGRLKLVTCSLIVGVLLVAGALGVNFIERHNFLLARDQSRLLGINLIDSQQKFAYSGSDFNDYRELGDLYFSEALKDSSHFLSSMTKAKSAYFRAHQLHPFDLKSEVALGVCYDYLGEFAKADRLLRSAASRGAVRDVYLLTHRRLAQHYLAWGLDFYKKRKPGEALFCFKEGLDFILKTNQYDEGVKDERSLLEEYIEFFQRTGIKSKAFGPYEGPSRGTDLRHK